MCINFFYGRHGGSPPLAKLFPEDFQESIPEHAVVVVMVAVSDQITQFTALTTFNRYSGALMTIMTGQRNTPN